MDFRLIKLNKSDGTFFYATIYLSKKHYRRITCSCDYGELVFNANYLTPDSMIKSLYQQILTKKRFKDAYFDRPFYQKDDYIFKLGKKLKITNDGFNKYNDQYYYVKSKDSDLLTKYKKEFHTYLKKRLLELSLIMGLDISDFKISVGDYKTFRGECIPTRKRLKFNIKLFAYTPQIIDSILYHELNHLKYRGHDKKFYNSLLNYCPNYKKLDILISQGKFEGI